jgi:beta-galactosidase/beta-glucuronidase
MTTNTKTIPRSEYPRPEAKRENWITLNGEWDFEFDPLHQGLKNGFASKPVLSKKIQVPFVYQSKLSGIDSQEFIDTVWYSRKVNIPEKYWKNNIILNFGAVDYECTVYINGNYCGFHRGGVTPFYFDITTFLSDDKNEEQLIVVHVFDPPFDKEVSKGKQATEERFHGCDYQTSTGIWQPVWLEFVNEVYLDRSDYFIRADPNTGIVQVQMQIKGNNARAPVLEAQVFDGDTPISEIGFNMGNWLNKFQDPQQIELTVDKSKIELWSPSNPKLYTVKFNAIDGDSDEDDVVLDQMIGTFGFRTFEVKGDQIYLNGEKIYLKQPLYQGYWPKGLWTPPSDEAMKRDIELTLEMGYNSLRLHQKVEDPRLLYWADKLGVLIWGEFANARSGSARTKDNFTREWSEAVRRDRSHPSIIVWVPINESWGTGDLTQKSNQEWLKSLYYLTKTMDPTRPVVDNDGWEHVKTDICTIHDYSLADVYEKTYPEQKPADMVEFIDKLPRGKPVYAPGCKHTDVPITISEWGGWGLNIDDPNAKPDKFTCWGYQGILYKSFDEILNMYEATIKCLVKRKDWIVGHCYTEFNDQYQEMNGMLTFDRRPKGDLKRLKAINDLL